MQRPTLNSLIRHNAESIPEKVAIVYGNKQQSFSSHYEQAIKLANALAGWGCKPQDRISILAKNCLQYLEIYSACECGGFILVPVNFRLSTAEITYIIENTQAKFCFYTAEFSDTVNSLKRAKTGVQQFCCIDKEETTNNAYKQLLASGEVVAPSYVPKADDTACIIHTSGTTGRPKGAMLSQAALYGIAETISVDAGIETSDYALIMQPLFHVGALFLQLSHHIRGARIRLEQGFDPGSVWDMLSEQTITTMQVVPTMLDMLLEEKNDSHYPKTRLKTIFYSTAPIRESLLRKGLQVFGQVFIQQYGSTEAGQITSLKKQQHLVDGTLEQQQWLKSAGKVNPGIELRITESDKDLDTTGKTGEILVKHPNLMQGYWNDIEATEAAMSNGYLRMGDMGRLEEDGFLYIIDRKKDMIISGGENIYPREVELALLSHEAIKEAAVIGIPDERWGESVLAIVVCKQGFRVTEEQLIAHCKAQIASYKKPGEVKFVAELPRIATGKIDKVALRRPYWETQQSQVI